MRKLAVSIYNIEQRQVYGLRKDANDKTVSKDIKALSQAYHRAVSIPEGKVLPYFVVSRNYDKKTGRFEMLIGGALAVDGLESFTLPCGEYAIITIRPKFGFLWGAAIGEAKRYFYAEWLPQSPYEALNMEYEYHSEKSMGKRPAVDLLFAVRKKG